MSEFKTQIVKASRELTAKEKFILTHIDNAIALDKALEDEKSDPIVIDVDTWAICSVHNDNARPGRSDYNMLVLVDVNNIKYSSGSETLLSNFAECWDAIQEIKAEGDDAKIAVYKQASRNNAGKCFITCTVI